jgi:hypothetical protein
MLIFPESNKNVAKYFHPSFQELKKKITFANGRVNIFFLVAAISVGRSKRGNKQDFILSQVSPVYNSTGLLVRKYVSGKLRVISFQKIEVEWK